MEPVVLFGAITAVCALVGTFLVIRTHVFQVPLMQQQTHESILKSNSLLDQGIREQIALLLQQRKEQVEELSAENEEQATEIKNLKKDIATLNDQVIAQVRDLMAKNQDIAVLGHNIEALQERVTELEQENATLRRAVKDHEIAVP